MRVAQRLEGGTRKNIKKKFGCEIYLSPCKLEDGDSLSVALQFVAARQAEEARPPAVGDVQRIPLCRLHEPASATRYLGLH